MENKYVGYVVDCVTEDGVQKIISLYNELPLGVFLKTATAVFEVKDRKGKYREFVDFQSDLDAVSSQGPGKLEERLKKFCSEKDLFLRRMPKTP